MLHLFRIKPILAACFLVLFCCFSIDGQSVERRFVDGDYVLEVSLWTKEDGLPSWHVFDFIEDNRGYIWMGTDVGLVRFDGRNFTVYSGGKRGIRENSVGKLAEDVNGNIWLYHYKDEEWLIAVFDPIEEYAVSIESYLKEVLPLSLYSYKGFLRQQDTIWILDPGTGKGGRYRGTWEWLLNDTTTANSAHSDFTFYYPRKDNLFWVWDAPHEQATLRLIDKNGKALPYPAFQSSERSFTSLDEDLNMYHWSGSPNANTIDTLFRFDKEGAKAFPFGKFPSISWGNVVPHDFGPFLKINKNNIGLKGNEQAAFFFKGKDVFFDDLNVLLGLEFKTRIYDNVFLAEDDTFWFTSPAGLLRMRIKEKLFTTYPTLDKKVMSVRGIVGVGDSLLITNTYAGAVQIDLTNKSYTPLPIVDRFRNLGLLKEGNSIWISKAFSNLMRYDLLSKDYQKIDFQHSENEYNGYRFQRLNDSTMLLASSLGVLQFNEKTQWFTDYCLQDTSTYYWHANKQGIWLGTRYGLVLFDQDGKVKARYPIHEDELRVYYIYEDKEGLFWLGTNEGLICWNSITGTHRQFTVQDGLSDIMIHAIFEDSYGHLWLPSNYGLMRFRKSDGYVTTYLEKDGLPSNEFNFLAYFQREDGLLFLGGVNGIVSFHPDSIGTQQQTVFHLEIANVAVYDRKTEAVINRTRQGIEQGMLEVKPSQNHLVVSLVPHYFSEREMVYEWRFPEENEQWKALSGPSLSLINPAYGTYPVEFRAYPIGNKNLQSEILRLQLKVLKPIYWRWWFIALLSLVIGGGFLGYFRFRQLQLKLRNEVLEQEVNDRTLELQERLITIDQQAKELRQLDEMKSRFFINISHELRTPLSMILGPVTSLSKQSFPPEQMSQLERIKRSTKQLRQMTEEILDLARLEAGKLELREEVVLFSSFIGRVFNAFHSLAESRDIAYELEIDMPADLRLKLDAQKVERMMNNLISNALKFTGRGGEVMVRASVDSTIIMLSVEDTGIGINEADLARVFDRYYQARHQKYLENGGLGIGLAMCKELAGFLGGQLEVKSQLGKGSIFFLRLPIVIAEKTDLEYKTSKWPDIITKTRLLTLPPPASVKGQPKVLVVEDNDDFRMYLMEILGPYFRLVPAHDGLDALGILSQQEVDLVVSDVMMPRMDGFELLKAVRSQPQQWGLPFILLTARSEQTDQLYGLRLGVDTYLSKPFEENELIARIHNLLSNQQKRKAAFEAEITPLKESALPSNELTETPQGPSFDELWLIDLETYLNKRIQDTHLKVGDLAHAMAMSERSFRDKLKSCTGLKPSQYILQARLQLAYRLLEEKRYPTIAELAYAVGFQSKAYFSKSFKSLYGKSPSELVW